MWIWIAGLILCLFAVLLCLPISAELVYRKNLYNRETHFRIYWMGISIPLSDGKRKPKQTAEKPRDAELLQKAEAVGEAYRELSGEISGLCGFLAKKAVQIYDLHFSLDFGAEDPAVTGILSGIIYGVYYNLLALIDRYFRLEKAETGIAPNFEQPCFSLEASCILRIKTVHIIIVLWKGFRIFTKYKRKQKERK